MKELEELKERMATQRPEDWERLPDLSLYMDQLISYMPRQLIRFEDGDVLTAAMVNNYIKDELLPRADGKRYGKEHLAWLTAICALKSVISMREMAALFGARDPEQGPRELYGIFLKELDRALTRTAQRLESQAEEETLAALALRLALDSYASKLACQRVLSLLEEQEKEAPQQGESKKKK